MLVHPMLAVVRHLVHRPLIGHHHAFLSPPQREEMSWLVNSIANSLNLDDENENHHPQTTTFATASTAGKNRPPRVPIEDDCHIASSSPYDEIAAARGVKEDLSELSGTLSRQFWGVASFLAPPPRISDRDRDRQSDDSDVDYAYEGVEIVGIRNELPEFGGNCEAEVSNVEQYGSEKELSVEDYARRGVVGVTEEVVAFARNIALHPETWIDFPLPDDDIEDDYELSDAQQEHAMAVERLAPNVRDNWEKREKRRTWKEGPGDQVAMDKRAEAGPKDAGSVVVDTTKVTIFGSKSCRQNLNLCAIL